MPLARSYMVGKPESVQGSGLPGASPEHALIFVDLRFDRHCQK